MSEASYRRSLLYREVSAAKDAYRAAGAVGALRLRREAYHSINPDYRAKRGDATYPSILCAIPQSGTCLVPVEFVEVES